MLFGNFTLRSNFALRRLRRAGKRIGENAFRLEKPLLFHRGAQQHEHIARKHGEHDEPVPPLQSAAPIPEADDQNACEQQHGKIEFQGIFLHGKIVHERGQTQNEQNIDDVASDHVPDGDVRGFLDGGGDGNGKFRHACTERDDGQPDHERRNFTEPRRTRSAVHEPIRALYEKRQPDHEQYDIQSHNFLSSVSMDASCAAHTPAAPR